MVGVTTNKRELVEIENIVKVFLVAERVIDLASEIKSEKLNINKLNSTKELKINPNPYNRYLKPLNVRGFN